MWSPTLDQGMGGWPENKPFLFLLNSPRNFGTVLGLFMNWRPISEDIFCNLFYLDTIFTLFRLKILCISALRINLYTHLMYLQKTCIISMLTTTNLFWIISILTHLVGGFKHALFSIMYGMSSFPLTNSMIFQDGHIAPPTSYNLDEYLQILVNLPPTTNH